MSSLPSTIYSWGGGDVWLTKICLEHCNINERTKTKPLISEARQGANQQSEHRRFMDQQLPGIR